MVDVNFTKDDAIEIVCNIAYILVGADLLLALVASIQYLSTLFG